MFLGQLCLFIGCRKKDFYKYEDEIEMDFDFDFKEIDINGYDIDLDNIDEFKCQKKSLRFHHTSFQQKIIKSMINININTPVGMGRVIHKSNLAKMYRHFDYSTVSI
jgi:predicted transcriptional regulator